MLYIANYILTLCPFSPCLWCIFVLFKTFLLRHMYIQSIKVFKIQLEIQKKKMQLKNKAWNHFPPPHQDTERFKHLESLTNALSWSVSYCKGNQYCDLKDSFSKWKLHHATLLSKSLQRLPIALKQQSRPPIRVRKALWCGQTLFKQLDRKFFCLCRTYSLQSQLFNLARV